MESQSNTIEAEKPAASGGQDEATESRRAPHSPDAGARQKVVITLMDGEKPGQLECSMEFEPDVTDDTRSIAVHAAMRMLDAIKD